MKLLEIWGRGGERSKEQQWRDDLLNQAADRARAIHGFWIITKQGKKLFGPFPSGVAAEQFKIGRNLQNVVIRQL